MKDFNGFNPDKSKNLGGAGFNPRQGKGSQPEKAADATPATPAGDPYADQKLDPQYLMNLMSTQAKQNVPADVEHASIYQSVGAFMEKYPPEQYDAIGKMVRDTVQQELGGTAPDALVNEIRDNYLIGIPQIQPQQA